MARASKPDAPREFLRDFGAQAATMWSIWQVLSTTHGKGWFESEPVDTLMAAGVMPGWSASQYQNAANGLCATEWLERRGGSVTAGPVRYRICDQRSSALVATVSLGDWKRRAGGPPMKRRKYHPSGRPSAERAPKAIIPPAPSPKSIAATNAPRPHLTPPPPAQMELFPNG